MATDSQHRPSPDQLLAEVEREEIRKRRGRLKVFLGYASGVGKSFQMLDEGRRRRERGEDVVVCAVQPEYPPEIQSVLQKLEIIPMLKMGGEEIINVPAVIERRLQVVLIDGLAYDNPPGSPNCHRWQDVPKKQNFLSRLLFTDLVLRIVRNAKEIRVIIVAERRQHHPAPV